MHIYIDGGPGTSPYNYWALKADLPSPDLNGTNTGAGQFFINPPPGKGYRFSMNPQANPLPGLDLSAGHVLNFYTPNVPIQDPFTGNLTGATMGSRLVYSTLMDASPCPGGQGFNINPTGQVTLDDEENPKSATFTGLINTNHKLRTLTASP